MKLACGEVRLVLDRCAVEKLHLLVVLRWQL